MIQGDRRVDARYNISNGEAFNNKEINRQYVNEKGLYYPKSITKFSKADQTNVLHPTEKPLPLLQYLVQTYSNPAFLGLTLLPTLTWGLR